MTTTFTNGPPVSLPVVFPDPWKGSGPVSVQFILNIPASEVSLKVFTTAFRKIQETDLSNVPSGVIQTPLNLTGPQGVPLANGLYYLLVTTRQGHAVGKLLVIR